MISVIGGGISGLSAAWFLHRAGYAVRVLERRGLPGGVIATDRGDGYLVELGPNSTLQKGGRQGEALGDLIEGTGLAGRLREAGGAGKKRYVMRGGRLRPLPGSPPAFLATSLFSWGAKLRLLREPFIGRHDGEETIAQFVERRLGREFLDYAVEPFISGVYAGDPRQLSVRAAVPRIYELERDHGSLIRGAIALGRAAKGAGQPAGRLISFADGMEALPMAIAAALPPDGCRTGVTVSRIRPSEGGWRIDWRGAEGSGTDRADRVVLATPAAEAAELLAPLSAEAAEVLRGIVYASIASVALGYRTGGVGHALDGFGFLAPRREGLRLLGGLFSSTLFPGRAPDGACLITTFIGGAGDPDAVDLGDDELIEVIRREIERTLEITGDPVFVRVARHARAIPQYTLGHLDRVARLDRLVAGFPGLHLMGSWRDGVSVADCADSGRRMAERLTGVGPAGVAAAHPKKRTNGIWPAPRASGAGSRRSETAAEGTAR